MQLLCLKLLRLVLTVFTRKFKD